MSERQPQRGARRFGRVVAAGLLVLAGSADQGRAQTVGGGAFRVGDRIECDSSGVNAFDKGTVVPYLAGDREEDGYVRVRIDKYKLYPEGVLCPVAHMRRLAAAEPP